MLQLNVRILVDFGHVPYIDLGFFLYYRIHGLLHHRKCSGEKRFSRSEKSQRILFWVREKCFYEVRPRKII